METINLKELSKPITIKGIPRENILVSLVFSVSFIVIANLFIAIIIFLLLFSLLSFLSRHDVDFIKIIIDKIQIGFTFSKTSSGGNLYVA
jgi:type IV secretory pathway VirB3-like protein